MADTSARLLRMLSLLQGRRDWSGRELAERLGVSARTIRNDVSRLRRLGYPVDATPGVAGGYRLAAGSTTAPLLLDDDEAVAVAVGLRTAACASLAGIEETSLRTLTKLEQILPSRLRRQVEALQSHVEPMRWRTPHSLVDPEALALLSQACRDREQVRFDYEDRNGALTRRLVEPYALVADGHRWYLVAWDARRADWRTFRVDRTSELRLAGGRFTRRELPAPDAASFVRDRRAGGRPAVPAVVILHLPAEELHRTRRAALDELQPIDDRSCRLRTTVDDLEGLVWRLAMIGCEFEVESPPELVDLLRRVGERLARATTAAAPR